MPLPSDLSHLHPESQARLKLFEESGGKYYFDMDTIEGARQSSWESIQATTLPQPFDGSTTEHFVSLEEVPNGVPVFVYKPNKLPVDPQILVYFHGGGFTVGCREGYETMLKIIAQEAGCIIVNVEYRMGPEHKTPAWLDDSVAATKWAMSNKDNIGGTGKSQVGVSGDSAGGCIAGTVAYHLPGIDYQILVYPHLDHRCLLPSYTEYADDHLLTMKLITWFHSNYISEEQKTDPKYNVLQQTEFKHVPRCLFIVAECDPLRDDSIEYAKKLDEAGVPNETLNLKGILHGFIQANGAYPENSKIAYDRIIEYLKKIKQ
ncbi:unnamed protein product [Owenia fusiformis]|uniref:Uncharacterized protein n=1 Tax=Owenia fusiformis TaxID=6347 RepID=A0A8J1UDC6_OWEFU|nr:unnamed protein product [Owenia fusiformis]